MAQKNIEYIKPLNRIQQKTGIGGLSPDIIARAQEIADNTVFDYMPFAKHKINIMKEQMKSDDFLSANNDNSIDDFLFNLVPLDVNMKLCKNEPLAMITSHLIKFVEKLPAFNIDAFQVIRAHVSALDITFQKSIIDPENHVFQVLIKELNNACTRYDEKYRDQVSSYENLMEDLQKDSN